MAPIKKLKMKPIKPKPTKIGPKFKAVKNAHLYVPKMALRVTNLNSETTFISPTTPKIDKIAFCFKCLPLSDGF